MSLDQYFDRLTVFVEHMHRLDTVEERRDAFIAEIREHGGEYVAPVPSVASPRMMFSVQLHGVHAYGEDEDDAITRWMLGAESAIGVSTVAPVPFPNPRNHAEEIANAFAERESRRRAHG